MPTNIARVTSTRTACGTTASIALVGVVPTTSTAAATDETAARGTAAPSRPSGREVRARRHRRPQWPARAASAPEMRLRQTCELLPYVETLRRYWHLFLYAYYFFRLIYANCCGDEYYSHRTQLGGSVFIACVHSRHIWFGLIHFMSASAR